MLDTSLKELDNVVLLGLGIMFQSGNFYQYSYLEVPKPLMQVLQNSYEQEDAETR